MIKVGDVVYQFDNCNNVYKSEVKSIYVSGGFTVYDCGGNNIAFDERAIGKSVFLKK